MTVEEAAQFHQQLSQEMSRLAEVAEQPMLSENRDWFVVMQFHDVELRVSIWKSSRD